MMNGQERHGSGLLLPVLGSPIGLGITHRIARSSFPSAGNWKPVPDLHGFQDSGTVAAFAGTQ